MSVIASALKHMLAAGMPHEKIVEAVEEMEAALPKDEQAERRRAKDRERKRGLRNSAESADSADKVSPKKETSPTPPKEKTTPSISEAKASSSPEPDKSAPVAIGLPTVSEGDFPVSETDVSEWAEAFPAVHIRQQLAAMRQWLLANPSRRKTRRGMRKFIVSWLDRRQNTGPPPSVEQRGTSPPTQDFNSILDAIQGKSHAAHTGPVIDGSHERGDRGGFAGVVQLHAVPARR